MAEQLVSIAHGLLLCDWSAFGIPEFQLWQRTPSLELLCFLLFIKCFSFSECHSFHFSRTVIYDSFRPRGLQHARLPCPSPTAGRSLLKLVSELVNAIQSSHPLSSPYPPAFSLSQHWGLFQWVSSSHQVAKVSIQLQHQSFQWTPRTDLL